MKTGNVVLGLLAGIATGAILGILFAPHSGVKTRRRIMAKGAGYADEVKDKFGEYVDTLKESYQGMKQDAVDVVSK